MNRLRLLTGILDAPARSALTLAARSPSHTLFVGLAGLGAVALATVAGQGLAHGFGGIASTPMWSIRGVALALAVVCPAAVALSMQLRIGARPRILVGGLVAGLLTGGLVVASLVPMMTFMALIADDVLPIWLSPAVLFPLIALEATALVAMRVVRTFSNGADALFGYALVVAFPAVYCASVYASVIQALTCGG